MIKRDDRKGEGGLTSSDCRTRFQTTVGCFGLMLEAVLRMAEEGQDAAKKGLGNGDVATGQIAVAAGRQFN